MASPYNIYEYWTSSRPSAMPDITALEANNEKNDFIYFCYASVERFVIMNLLLL
jgi:hypothetical protein